MAVLSKERPRGILFNTSDDREKRRFFVFVIFVVFFDGNNTSFCYVTLQLFYLLFRKFVIFNRI